MGRASIVSRIVYAAAKLGLADQLASGPKSAAELADGMQVHAPSLHRLMRTLASLGILTEQTEQRFALTDLGKALKTGAPGSAKSTLLFMGSLGNRVAGTIWSTPFRPANLALKRPKACHSLIASRSIQMTHRSLARPWLASTTRNLQRSPLPTTFQSLILSWTWAERPATCFRPCNPSIRDRAAYCSTGSTS